MADKTTNNGEGEQFGEGIIEAGTRAEHDAAMERVYNRRAETDAVMERVHREERERLGEVD